MSETTVNVRYMVDDVEAAVAFYTKLLGFEVLTSFPPAFADVARGKLRLLLSGPTSSAGRPMPDGAKPGPGGWNRIHLIVDDLEAEVAAASYDEVMAGQFGNLRFVYLDTFAELGAYVELVEDPDRMMMQLCPWRG